jgi:hypothetical protein
MDYGAGGEIRDGLNRYWLWDSSSNTGAHILGLVSQQIVDLQVLDEEFDPAQLGVWPPQWFVPRNWNWQPQSMDAPIGAPMPFGVATRTVGGRVRRPETAPANEE